jgi:hypothetical protein
VKLNTNRYLHLLLRLMSTTIPPYSCVLIEWKRKTLPFYAQECVISFTPRPLDPHYPLNKKLGGPPKCLDFSEEKKSPLSSHSIKSICLGRSKSQISYCQFHATNTTALQCNYGYVVHCHLISINRQFWGSNLRATPLYGHDRQHKFKFF